MKFITSISVMSFLPISIALLPVHAEPTQNASPLVSVPYAVTVSPPDQEITLPDHAYTLRVGEFDDVRGQYDMSNGKVLSMTSGGRSIFAELDGFEKMELVAVTSNIFVTKNRQMKMVFKQYPNGNVTGVTLTYLNEHPNSAALNYVTLVSKSD